MRLSRCLNAALVACALALAPVALAAVPGEVNYQGLLLDAVGDPVTGPTDIDFALFDTASGGANVWSESHAAVDVLDGVYDVILGTTTPITPALVAGGALWLEVTVEGETLTPRQRIVAVPYALRAAEADNVGGVSNVFISQLYEHYNADGGGPPNDDPSEGVSDADGDGMANFIDPDNDDDGLSDVVEAAQGSDLNLVTPTIASIVPDVVDTVLTTRVVVTGTNFDPAMTAAFGAANPALIGVTATSFEADVGPAAISSGASVTLPNGESDQAGFEIVSTVPSIVSITPQPVLSTATTRVLVTGENFFSGAAVTVDGVPATAYNYSSTSFEIDVGPHAAGSVPVVVTNPDAQFATASVALADLEIGAAFVTSASYDGNVGGLAGADAKCAAAATAAALPGSFLAWLSDGTTDPAARFSRIHEWRRTDGTTIANDWPDLTDGSIDAPIQYDEFGAIVPSAFVASNVDASGHTKETDNTKHCVGWTANSIFTGRPGIADGINVNAQWTDFSARNCSLSFRLYCFEQ